ncbi:MAG: hypothetical protein QOJ64_1296, partial [Acidobacteriota bacterium]|nr:hypothetical protein [Acidobacteriota bacterium]
MSSNKSDSSPKKGASVPGQPLADKLPIERAQFREMLLQNPNFFGTLTDSSFKVVKAISSNTTFEELKCVGFNPQLDQIEAVIYIKRDTGYGGGICSDGTPEYVRFYVSHNNGAAWHDIGMAQFTAQDIPGTKPLEYAVTQQYKTLRKLCFVENVIKVRAILSWNNPPPPNTPNFSPVWGNVREANVQIAPAFDIKVADIFDQLDLKLSTVALKSLDPAQAIKAAQSKPLGITELQTLYKGNKEVPEHRFLFPTIKKQLDTAFIPLAPPPPTIASLKPTVGPPPPVAPPPPTLTSSVSASFADLKIDISKLLDLIAKTDGNTNFEELNCVGLESNTDTLVGVLTVKLKNGYSGPLCSAGSREYVAFWVDWGDGTGWNHAGTTSVIVHDIANLPAGGLQYAVLQPINTLAQRKPCNQGAKTAKVRAILSWEFPPPANNPNFVPTWGNREETLVVLKPGPSVVPGDMKPYFETVGREAVCHINQTTGFATGDRPFGGVVDITGFIISAPDIGSPNPLKYKITVTELATGSVSTVDNGFG